MSYIIKYKGRGYLSWGNIFQESTQVLFDRMNHYTDHLGNIRLSYGRDPETNEITILKESHYYPFGLQHRGYVGDHRVFEQVLPIGRVNLIPVRNYLDDSYRYTFGGKEEQPELGLNWIDHHARNYDAALGRWIYPVK